MSPQQPTQTTSQSKPKIRYHKGNHYSVESRTRAGHTHHIDTYHLTCSCEAGQRGKRCWALAVALEYERWRRRQAALAAAAAQEARVPAPARPAETGMAALQAAFGE